MGKLRDKFARFMIGRYGVDNLGRVLVYASLILLILSMFIRYRIVYILAIAALIYAYFRIFSKNVSKRYEENRKFLNLQHKISGRFSALKNQGQDKDHRYFKCPACKQKVRVPKGKGKISIRCPKCHAEFIKRT
ncbi:hypothetical protein MCG98_09685 [Ruminococcus sp. OA3]|uniref:hypothetical protein n=1 Tax=Ruminococcus sp. OA3 TaxID=2914164 RepID=UPI001F0681E5|nr:hypothetical protein [Ruminococcus sp. OA3]MCH1982835.1 hypothetical protein [Ruminococcus sp. OA3]